jgi:hypothetical protein
MRGKREGEPFVPSALRLLPKTFAASDLCRRWVQSLPARFASGRPDVRNAPVCGRLRVGKDFLHVSSIGRCGRVFGLSVGRAKKAVAGS